MRRRRWRGQACSSVFAASSCGGAVAAEHVGACALVRRPCVPSAVARRPPGERVHRRRREVHAEPTSCRSRAGSRMRRATSSTRSTSRARSAATASATGPGGSTSTAAPNARSLAVRPPRHDVPGVGAPPRHDVPEDRVPERRRGPDLSHRFERVLARGHAGVLRAEGAGEPNFDAITCASPAYTDKGVFSTTETSLYPPRADIAFAQRPARRRTIASTMYQAINPFDAVTQATPPGGTLSRHPLGRAAERRLRRLRAVPRGVARRTTSTRRTTRPRIRRRRTSRTARLRPAVSRPAVGRVHGAVHDRRRRRRATTDDVRRLRRSRRQRRHAARARRDDHDRHAGLGRVAARAVSTVTAHVPRAARRAARARGRAARRRPPAWSRPRSSRRARRSRSPSPTRATSVDRLRHHACARSTTSPTPTSTSRRTVHGRRCCPAAPARTQSFELAGLLPETDVLGRHSRRATTASRRARSRRRASRRAARRAARSMRASSRPRPTAR